MIFRIQRQQKVPVVPGGDYRNKWAAKHPLHLWHLKKISSFSYFTAEILSSNLFYFIIDTSDTTRVPNALDKSFFIPLNDANHTATCFI